MASRSRRRGKFLVWCVILSAMVFLTSRGDERATETRAVEPDPLDAMNALPRRWASRDVPLEGDPGKSLAFALERAEREREAFVHLDSLRATHASGVGSSADPGALLERRMRGKVAFLFLSKTTIPQHPVWTEFFRDADPSTYSIYVHADPGSPSQSGVFAGKVVPDAVPTEWGTFSVVRASVVLLKNALEDPDNARFALVSENAIPIAPFDAVRCTLLAEPRSVIDACEKSAPERRARLITRPETFPDWLGESAWRKSSQWWVLNRAHAEIVANDERTMREFEEKCVWVYNPMNLTVRTNRSCFADEHYFPTSLAAAGRASETTCTDGVTYLDWSTAHTGHPVTFESVVQFLRHRARRVNHVDAMRCGNRAATIPGTQTHDAIAGATCGNGGAAGDWGWGEANFPRFERCLFARKFAPESAMEAKQAWGVTLGA